MAKRRIFGLYLLLVLALLASLPGCAGLPFGVRAEPVTLRFVYMEGAADYAPLAEAFTKENPNITVELNTVGWDGNVIRNIVTSAAEADAVRLPTFAMSEDIHDSFLPLDSLITADMDFPQEDLFPHSLEGLRLDGKQVGLPAGINPFVMYFIPDKFAAAGIQPPNAAWTMEDFVTSAMSVHAPEGTERPTFGFCTYPTLFDSVMFAYLFGGGILDSIYMPTQPTLNTPANVDSLRWYVGLKNDFGLMPPINSPRELGQQIAAGNCGFWIDTLNRSYFGRFGDFQAEPLPLPAYRAALSVADMDYYSVIASSSHPEEAYRWLRFLMLSQEASGGLIPPLRTQGKMPEYTARVSSYVAGVAQSLPEEMVILGLEVYRDVRMGVVLELYTEAAREVMFEQVDAQAALDEAQQEAEQRFR